METDSIHKYVDTSLWNSVNNRVMWETYLNASDIEIIQASPMQNKLPSIIPNTYIETSEFDCLHDEGVSYARRLQKAGVNVKLVDTKGTVHGYASALNSNIVKKNLQKE